MNEANILEGPCFHDGRKNKQILKPITYLAIIFQQNPGTPPGYPKVKVWRVRGMFQIRVDEKAKFHYLSSTENRTRKQPTSGYLIDYLHFSSANQTHPKFTPLSTALPRFELTDARPGMAPGG